jgi:hypothetical protein
MFYIVLQLSTPFEINSDITDDILIENPIPACADICIVLESKHQQARCRFLRFEDARFKSSMLLLSKWHSILRFFIIIIIINFIITSLPSETSSICTVNFERIHGLLWYMLWIMISILHRSFAYSLTQLTWPSAAILSPFPNGNKLRIASECSFFSRKSEHCGTRVRTARCMTLVHLCLFLSIACGHLPGIFRHVTNTGPRRETQRETLKYDAIPASKSRTHATHNHRTHKSQIETGTEPPHTLHTRFPTPHDTHNARTL